MESSILRVMSGDSLVGTAFSVFNNGVDSFVVTCGHVLHDCNDKIIVDTYPAHLLINKSKLGLDLAILVVKGVVFPALKLAEHGKFDSAYVDGYALLSGEIKKEKITDISIKNDVTLFKGENKEPVDHLKLYTNENISNGYSGSPVFCSGSDFVIGVVCMELQDNKNLAVSCKHFCEVLSSIGNYIPDLQMPTKTIESSISTEQSSKIDSILQSKVEKGLQTFDGLPALWAEPLLYNHPEFSHHEKDNVKRILLDDMVLKPKSSVIKANQQFGLSSLAHSLVLRAWRQDTPQFWFYINIENLKPNINALKKYETEIFKEIGLNQKDVCCVVVDQYVPGAAKKILSLINQRYPDVPLVVMHSHASHKESVDAELKNLGRAFEYLYLWALDRKGIRELVSGYNETKYIGDESALVSTLSNDLEVLNIHRTPLNCITLLKSYEAQFDENAVNRTDLIRRVLYVLFNVDQIPQYKTRPDLRDVEHILGFFSEKQINENIEDFDRTYFLSELRAYCKDRKISIEVDVIFDVLYANNIIIYDNGKFRYRFSFWIFYFAANRMHHSSDFAAAVFEKKIYSIHPEIVEFYTGLDRQRDDALVALTAELRTAIINLSTKYEFPSLTGLYDSASWEPSPKHLETLRKEVSDGVTSSNLPDEIKDEYADMSYDRSKPYIQSLRILKQPHMVSLMRTLTAASTALRNSDYSSPEIRHQVLTEITNGWKEIVNTLVAVTPILAYEGHVVVGGSGFTLAESFDVHNPETKEGLIQRFHAVLYMVPANISNWYVDDFLSTRMGPLITSQIEKEESTIIRHLLVLAIIRKRPNGWFRCTENYIKNEKKNSFYLADTLRQLRKEYAYGYVEDKTLARIERLIKMVGAKHLTGAKVPSKKLMNRMSDKILPSRTDNSADNEK